MLSIPARRSSRFSRRASRPRSPRKQVANARARTTPLYVYDAHPASLLPLKLSIIPNVGRGEDLLVLPREAMCICSGGWLRRAAYLNFLGGCRKTAHYRGWRRSRGDHGLRSRLSVAAAAALGTACFARDGELVRYAVKTARSASSLSCYQRKGPRGFARCRLQSKAAGRQTSARRIMLRVAAKPAPPKQGCGYPRPNIFLRRRSAPPPRRGWCSQLLIENPVRGRTRRRVRRAVFRRSCRGAADSAFRMTRRRAADSEKERSKEAHGRCCLITQLFARLAAGAMIEPFVGQRRRLRGGFLPIGR